MIAHRMSINLVIFLLLSSFAFTEEVKCCGGEKPNQNSISLSSGEVTKFIDSVMQEGMREENIPGAVFVLVQNGKIVVSKGFGYANLQQKTPVDAGRTIFPIASISKVFTATAVVQLADRKKIDLNTDVNQYLRKLKVPNTLNQPIIPAHLLNHTSGLDEIRPGTQSDSEREILPLHEFLKDRLVRIHPPGLVTSYSTYGITLAGLLVEEVSGLSYETYLQQNIWKPLQMDRTHITTPGKLLQDVAIGYASEGKVVQRVPYEWYHTIPASSIRSTANDMAHFMIAHLQCGRFNTTRILSESAACQMHRTQSTTHPLLPGWTYGFQEDDTNGLRILEHGGDIAGFGSLLVLLPNENIGFFVAHHLEGADLRFKVKQAFLDRYFPDKRPVVVPTVKPDLKKQIVRFGGLYRANIFCHSCEKPLPVAEVQVTANDDGTITVWDHRWVEVSPLFFKRSDGKGRIGFQEDKTGRILQMSAGSWKVLEKIK
jgi:CubicO group peptidase (beta-lactamase class C family)